MRKKLFAIVMSMTMVASFMPSIAFAAADPAGYDAQNIKCWDWTSGSTTATLKYVVDSNGVTKSVNAPATVKYKGNVKCGERVTGVDVTFTAKYSGHKYEYVYKNQTVDFPDHDYVTVPAKAATCTADGNKEYTYCKNCEDSKVPAGKVVAAAHHVDSLSSDSKYWDRTGNQVGLKKDAKVVCKDCGKTFTLEGATDKVTLDVDGTETGCSAAKVETADVTVAANGAADANDAYNTKPIIVAYSKTTPNATATDHTPKAWAFEWGENNGINTTAKYVQRCENCNTVLKSYDAVVSVATDSKSGDVTCSTSGNLRLIAEYASQTGTKSDEHVIADYPALGHKYVYVAKKAATCKEDGVEEHYTCSVCKKNFKVNDKTGKVLIQDGNPVAADDAFLKIAKAHNMEGTWTWTKNTAGTAFDTVTVKDLKCKSCGVVYNGTEPATPELVAEEGEDPTCTKAGVKVYKATAAGTVSVTPVGSSTPVAEAWTAEAKKEIEVKALGHDWTSSEAFDWDVDANGNPVCNVTLQKCRRCGELGKAYACEVVAEKMPEKTSSMTDAQYAAIVKAFEARNYAATCTKEGKVTAVASYTDDLGNKYEQTKTLVIPRTGHKVEVETVDATCTEAGVKTIKCSVCNEVFDTVEIPALGHDFVKTDDVKAPTCTEAGHQGYKCSACDETKVEELAALGHTVVEDAAVAATATKTGLTAGSHCSVCNEVLEAQVVTVAKAKTPSVKAGKKSLTVTASKVTGATKYQVAYKRSGSKYAWKYATASTKNAQTIKNLVKGKKYYVKVRTISGDVVGAWSSTKSVKVK